eukprot:g40246.t1
MVRPLLEYSIQFWSPSYGKDIVKLDRVLKRFIRMLPGMENLTCKERLVRLGLFSLEHRKLRVDLTEVYKIMRSIDWVNDSYLFPRMGDFKTRGRIFKDQDQQSTELDIISLVAAKTEIRGLVIRDCSLKLVRGLWAMVEERRELLNVRFDSLERSWVILQYNLDRKYCITQEQLSKEKHQDVELDEALLIDDRTQLYLTLEGIQDLIDKPFQSLSFFFLYLPFGESSIVGAVVAAMAAAAGLWQLVTRHLVCPGGPLLVSGIAALSVPGMCGIKEFCKTRVSENHREIPTFVESNLAHSKMIVVIEVVAITESPLSTSWCYHRPEPELDRPYKYNDFKSRSEARNAAMSNSPPDSPKSVYHLQGTSQTSPSLLLQLPLSNIVPGLLAMCSDSAATGT